MTVLMTPTSVHGLNGSAQPAATNNELALAALRQQVAHCAALEGRNDSELEGLRCYRFSHSCNYEKTQLLMPGVVIVVQGEKQARLGGSSFTYNPFHCLVLPSHAVCQGTVVTATPGHPYLAIHLDLPPDLLLNALSRMPPQPGADGSLARQFLAPVDMALLDACGRLLSASGTSMGRHALAPLIIEEIIVRLLCSDAAPAIRDSALLSRTARRIQDVIRLIGERYREPLSIEAMARHAAMSPSHFAHTFRAVAGLSPMRYLRNTRLEAARRLMLSEGLRPGAAALEAGFESASHFAREFKRRYDQTPGEWLSRMGLPKSAEKAPLFAATGNASATDGR